MGEIINREEEIKKILEKGEKGELYYTVIDTSPDTVYTYVILYTEGDPSWTLSLEENVNLGLIKPLRKEDILYYYIGTERIIIFAKQRFKAFYRRHVRDATGKKKTFYGIETSSSYWLGRFLYKNYYPVEPELKKFFDLVP